jgi:gliding motility associated protien GldN
MMNKQSVMKKFVNNILLICLFTAFTASAWGQEASLGHNPNSVYPIPDANQMYKRTVWRRMDLKEKQNRPFFSTSNEITRIIINAVNDGTLYPYEDDSLNKRMSKEQFLENLKLPTAEEDDFGSDEGFQEDTWADSGWGDDAVAAEDLNPYYDASQLTTVRIKEDMIFDKVRSRLYYDIQSIELIIPADQTATGLEKTVGVFKYKDLEMLFRSMPEQAIWYNRQNTAGHLNMADAFVLRLFSARIVKVSNPRNDWIQDIYLDPRTALIKSQQIEHQLIEYEHNLWEY